MSVRGVAQVARLVPMRLRYRALVVALLVVAAASSAAVPLAHASGSAGVVVENGDGSIDTYCVAFSGDSITGPELLAKAGISVVQWNGAVCAIGANPAEGCFAPHDFQSCYCKSYPPTNEYWSFFTQHDDQGWIYSSLGFESSILHNGDMQAWKWGVGGPSSAPPPPEITFAQVCGTKAAAPTVAQPVLSPTLQVTVLPSTTPAPATVTPMTGLVPTPRPSATDTPGAKPSATATVRITSHGSATATPIAVPVSHTGGGNSGFQSFAAFGGVVIVIVAAIAGALVFRRRQHGV